MVFQGKEYNCSLVRDITERKRAEETLRLSEERFSKAFQSSPVNLVISTLKEGRILDVNDKFVRTSGYSREELIGHTARELNVWPRPSDRAQAIKQLQEKGSIRNKEVFLRTKSGELRLHSYSAETVIVAGHLCVLMVAEDITERKQAEQALRQSEASLAEAQRISHLGSWQWNPSDGSVLGSVELYRIFGFDPERTPSDYDTFMDRIHPKDRTALEQVLNDAVQEKKPFSIEYRISRPDGSVRIVLSQGEHMPAKKDQPNWMVGTVQDITERKQAEEALRKQAQIIDQIHDAVVSTDLDGYVTSWNKGAERLFGHTGEEMLGKPIAEVYPPEEHTFLQNQVIAPLKQNGEHEVEVRMRRKSGKDFFAHLSLSLLRDSNGTPTGMIGYSMDITERKRTEQALRQQAQVIDQIHDSVVSTDLDDYITSWNKGAEKLYGYRAEEVLGKHISLVYLDRDRQLSQKQLIDPLLELEEGGVEVQRRRKSGELFDIHLSLSLLHDDKGTPIGRIGYSLDITERKRAEENLRALATRLEQSNRELQSFASVAAHDLQEPLRKILMFGDRLQAKCHQALTDQGRDYMDRMLNAAARMQTLIDNLLAFSRVTIQPQPFVPVDLNAVAREVLSDLEGRIVQEGGRVKIGKLPTIEADRTQMRQLLQNLISNALKFHRKEEAPVVRIRAQSPGGGARRRAGHSPGNELCQIIVEDNGIGFDQKYADRIFGIFQRLHGRQEFQGTGIGLALCRRIAERHGGSITAQSKPGQGTTFTVRLPIKQHQGEKVA